jgi:hypothetical protein
MLAHYHVARTGRDRVVYAAVEFPEGCPPETILIAGTTYVRDDAAEGEQSRARGRHEAREGAAHADQ